MPSPAATGELSPTSRRSAFTTRERGTQAYEEFTLQGLRVRKKFNEFFYLFHRDGLLPSRSGQQPRALALLARDRRAAAAGRRQALRSLPVVPAGADPALVPQGAEVSG